MPKKQIKKEKIEEDVEKVELKKAKNKDGQGEGKAADPRWEKVESIFKAAKEANESGNSDFDSLIEGLIETLQNLRDEEAGKNSLGGLGVGGPEMDIPEAEEQESGEEGEENKSEQ
jgi:hypothetical protein